MINQPGIVATNISFYDELAPDYEKMIRREPANGDTRMAVAEIFSSTVKKGLVIDFGGGTGQDLLWLSESGYSILFYEPSAGMRKEAIRKIYAMKNREVIKIAGENLNTTISLADLPAVSAEGAIANFAVLNCIDKPIAVFEAMAGRLNTNASFFILVLSKLYRRKMMPGLATKLNKLFSRRPFKIRLGNGKKSQLLFLHSEKELEHQASAWFNKAGEWLLQSGDYTLIHFLKK
jgi:SAM-dependent methyltransferase